MIEEKTMGIITALKETYPRKLPTSPRWGEASETVWSPTLMAFLIDDNV